MKKIILETIEWMIFIAGYITGYIAGLLGIEKRD